MSLTATTMSATVLLLQRSLDTETNFIDLAASEGLGLLRLTQPLDEWKSPGRCFEGPFQLFRLIHG